MNYLTLAALLGAAALVSLAEGRKGLAILFLAIAAWVPIVGLVLWLM